MATVSDWQVVVRVSLPLGERDEEFGYKFVISAYAASMMTVESFEEAMCKEMVHAIRSIKGKAIMEGVKL